VQSLSAAHTSAADTSARGNDIIADGSGRDEFPSHLRQKLDDIIAGGTSSGTQWKEANGGTLNVPPDLIQNAVTVSIAG
jgi:hypothetical protein